jgi:Protein of unknown function (DUF559)/Transcriptional regulator, AbiEi antitoxin
LSVARAILAAMREQQPRESWPAASQVPSRTADPVIKVFTSRRLRAGGRSPTQIRTLVSAGRLVAIGRGVYVTKALASEFADMPHGQHILRAAAAIWLGGPGCVLSHQSAALMHEIDLAGDELTHVTMYSRTGRRGLRHGVHRHLESLPEDHVTRRFGLPVTTAPRTVVDLARTAPFAEAVVAADSALYRGLVSPLELRTVAGECGSRGSARAARVVEFATGLAESPLESLARVVFDDQGIPPPELQVSIVGDSGFIGRVDFYWKQYRTIAEVDGALKYADPARARKQLWRDKALRQAGYEVVHFDWREITQHPEQVASTLRAAFRRGARAS